MIELTTQGIPYEAQPQVPQQTLHLPKLKMIQPVTAKVYEVHHFTGESCMDKLSYMLVRPPKITYDERLLIPPIRDSRYKYTVKKVPFDVSIYTPTAVPVEYYVLYLHGNSSSRLEGASMLRFMPPHAGLACFDFEACGNRSGEWITLGLKQSKEVDTVVEFLETKGVPVVLWGRSMGAVSAIMSNRATIMVLDSAFTSLKTVCLDTAKSNSKYIANCVIDCMFPCVYSLLRKDIMKKTNHDINELDIVKKVSQLPERYNIMFLAGEQDQMIHASHSKMLYDQFKGHKQCCWFEGTHNSTRSDQTLKHSFAFIEKSLARLRDKSQPSKLVEPSDTRITEKLSFETTQCQQPLNFE